MRRSHSVGVRLVLATAMLLAAFGCGRHLPLAPDAQKTPGGTNATGLALGAHRAGGTAQHMEGEIGPGALYGMDVPADWNGDLVLYLHGIKPPDAPVALPRGFEDFDEILAGLLGRGFAVAYSSYSENGYALAEGAPQSRQIAKLFTAQFGRPRRVFLFGQSLGALIGIYLAEKYPHDFAGGLLVSGVLGGSKAEVDYLAQTRVLFDYFYPGVLGGDLFHTGDPAFDPAAIVGAVLADGGAGLGAMARLKQIQLPYASPAELLESLVNGLGLQWIGGGDFLDRTHDHVLFDNHDTVYEPLAPGLLPPELLADLNHRVERYESTPDAEAWLQHHYEPTGDLTIPVLTLHTSRDPIVPNFHEQLYADRVKRMGHGDKLRQRTKDVYGHRNLLPDELMGAFDDLVAWVDHGTVPVP